MNNAIAFDMGGTTAKAGVIYDGDRADDRLGADRRLCHRPAGADADDRHPGGRHRRRQHRARRGRRGAARRPGKRRRAVPGPVCYGLGGTEPTITDANLILGRLGADRFLGGEMRLDLAAASRALTEKIAAAARPRSDRGSRRHPAHRHHQDGARGALGDHRARPRRRRLRADRLWRRGSAARVGGGARIADRHGGDPARAGPLLGLRHAGRRPAPRLRQHLVHAAGRSLVRGHGGDLRRDGGARTRDRHARPSALGHQRAPRRPTCATSGRSTPSRSNCRSSCSATRIATASRRASMPCTRPATASRCRTRRPRS